MELSPESHRRTTGKPSQHESDTLRHPRFRLQNPHLSCQQGGSLTRLNALGAGSRRFKSCRPEFAFQRKTRVFGYRTRVFVPIAVTHESTPSANRCTFRQSDATSWYNTRSYSKRGFAQTCRCSKPVQDKSKAQLYSALCASTLRIRSSSISGICAPIVHLTYPWCSPAAVWV